jgi:Family of unknown function (DUF5850)
MFDGKILITLIGLFAVIFATSNVNRSKFAKITEGFGMLPSFQTKTERIVANSPAAAAKGQFYSVPGTYQAILNPRFSNVDYGAAVRYNMPSYKNQAVPCEPLTFSNMAKENYANGGGCRGGCPVMSAGVPGGAPPSDPGYAAGNYNAALSAAYSGENAPAPAAALPVANMSALNAAGESIQPIVYQQYTFANRNSRLRSQGDPIRGDLPIVPCSSDWFRPSVNPNLDLQQGAMNVMGGFDNSTSKALSALMYNSSGNSQTVSGGVNLAHELARSASNGMQAVRINTFT